MEKTFYICSYGGCGSTMLTNALKKYGKVKHIHSKKPPNELEYIGNDNGGNCYEEWFNGIKIPSNEINNYYVIYIYKKPIKAILSRFTDPSHLEHIQVDKNIVLNDLINTSKDLYGIYEFYNNYTEPNKNRNYKIYSVKYEVLFDNQDQLSKLLNIGPLNLVKQETLRKIDYNVLLALYKIYKDLINKMDQNKFIIIN